MKEWTGERMETSVFNESTMEHLHRYAIAAKLGYNKKVLDIACGEGYGSNLLAMNAASVTGVDIDEKTIAAAEKKYKSSNLLFRSGNASNIPCKDQSFDLVVSFETIEHIDRHEEMMQEIKRVLKPGGLLVISTPDKKNYFDSNEYQNPYHIKELYKEEFEELVAKHFVYSKLYQQNFVNGSLIIGDAKKFENFSGDFKKIETLNPPAAYWIAFASDTELPVLSTSLFFNEEIFKEVIKAEQIVIKQTVSYKLGHFLLSPFKFFRSLFK